MENTGRTIMKLLQALHLSLFRNQATYRKLVLLIDYKVNK